MGIKKATDQLALSLIKPTKNEITAPPTMEVDKSPEALVVYLPSPLTDREKMVANMMELQIPTAIILQMARYPEVLMETVINKIDMAAQALRTRGGLTDWSTKAPSSRPTSMPPQ